MIVVRDLNNQTEPVVPSFVAIGCFDGVHLAHRKILETVISGKQEGLKPAVFTFDVNPDTAGKGMPLLMTTEEKLRIFEALGIEMVFLLQFADVKDITAESFVADVLRRQCGAQKVCCGYNFHFGKGGRANAAVLRQLCRGHGMEVAVVEEMDFLEQPVSSTRIRKLIQAGEITEANTLLGRPFSFAFPVVHGRKLGRKLGFPTMNQRLPDNFIQPRNGVYSSETVVDGVAYGSVTNIGFKPTVGGETAISAETWIQDFSGDLYGRTITVALHQFLREERKFPSLEALQAQILEDQARAARLYQQYKTT